jgi:hypothetical protein
MRFFLTMGRQQHGDLSKSVPRIKFGGILKSVVPQCWRQLTPGVIMLPMRCELND